VKARSRKRQWRAPKVVPAYDAFAEPTAWDDARSMLEHEALRKYTAGVGDDDLSDALLHMVVDLLDAGHYPSRHMLRMISRELQRLAWPDQGSPAKERQRNKEAAWLHLERATIDHLAATKYKDARNARASAEQEFAAMHGMKVRSLRRKRERYRSSLKQTTEARWQRRMQYPK
jgi:hypothetical protein